MPNVLRSARSMAAVRLNSSGLVEKNQAHFMPASEKDLLPDLKVMLLLTMSLFSSVLIGVYFCPLVTKSQWISSDRMMILCLRQSSPIRLSSAFVQALPVGLLGLQRIMVLVSGVMWCSRSSQSISYLPLTYFIWLSLATVLVKGRS